MKLKKIDLQVVNWKDYFIYYVFIGIFFLFSILLFNNGFLSGNNLMNITRQSAMIAIMAVGMTFVLAAGEIDLSLGAIVALSAILTAEVLRATNNILLSVLCGMSIGLFVGFINGIFVAKVGIPSFLVTIGMSGIVTGLARWVSHLQSIAVYNNTFTFIFGSGDIGPIPSLLIWTVVIMVIGHLVLNKTPFGRQVLATGGNKISALYSGIKVSNIKLFVMMINGVLAALSGILYAGRLHGARYTLGGTDTLTVIAAVVIGGTSMFGGKASVIGAVIGALIMGMLNNGLVLLGFSVDQQIIFRGCIIIVAVTLTMRENHT